MSKRIDERFEPIRLNRIYQCITHNAVGMISACRSFSGQAYREFADRLRNGESLNHIDEAQKYRLSPEDNMQRTRALLLDLKSLTAQLRKQSRLCSSSRSWNGSLSGFKTIKGLCKEQGVDMWQPVDSFIIWAPEDVQDTLLSVLTKLGSIYEQDFITFAPKDKKFSLICTSPDYISKAIGSDKNIGEIIQSFKRLSQPDDTSAKKSRAFLRQNPTLKQDMKKFLSKLGGKAFRWRDWGRVDWDTLGADYMIEGYLIRAHRHHYDTFHGAMAAKGLENNIAKLHRTIGKLHYIPRATHISGVVYGVTDKHAQKETRPTIINSVPRKHAEQNIFEQLSQQLDSTDETLIGNIQSILGDVVADFIENG